MYANPDEDAVELELSVSVEARAVVGDEPTAASKVLSRGSDSCSNDYASKRVGQSLSELHASCTPTWRVLSVWFVDALNLRACKRACVFVLRPQV